LVEDDDACERVSFRRDDALIRQMSPPDRWRAADELEVLSHSWGPDTVVYVQASAATHWLGRHAAAVFLTLRASTRAMTVNELSKTLALAPCDADDPPDVTMLLLQLHSLGIASIEPRHSDDRG
jgi:hypothetical protein